jgi:hypothetical protein
VRSLLVVIALASPAAAERTASLRAGVAVGALDEMAWTWPAIEVAGSFDVGTRAFVTAGIGYSSLDSHTFLSDGRTIKLAVAGGVRVNPRVRVAATAGVELVAFHADPDVLANHPDVDQLERRTATLPSVGVDAAYRLGAVAAIGAHARIALTELTLFDSPSGDRERARLVLAGAYLELSIR